MQKKESEITINTENKMDNVEKVVITNTSQDSPLEKECITKEHYPSGDSLQIVKQSGSISTKQDYYFVSMESLPKNSFDSLKRSVKFSLGLDLFKGMALTIKEFFSKPVTLQYPFEAQPLSPRYRAVHNLQRMLESGNERCIGCGLCEKICTSNCIRILTHEGEDGRKKIDSYTINLGRCIYCGLCAEVCPELAIVMGTRFENASEQRAHFGLKEDLLKDLEEARFHKQLEFEGFGSPRPSADKEIKQTPLDYKINEV